MRPSISASTRARASISHLPIPVRSPRWCVRLLARVFRCLLLGGCIHLDRARGVLRRGKNRTRRRQYGRCAIGRTVCGCQAGLLQGVLSAAVESWLSAQGHGPRIIRRNASLRPLYAHGCNRSTRLLFSATVAGTLRTPVKHARGHSRKHQSCTHTPTDSSRCAARHQLISRPENRGAELPLAEIFRMKDSDGARLRHQH